MRSWFIALGLITFCGTALAQAQESAVPQLIDQLASGDFKVREAAAKSLEAIGDAALPALRGAQSHKDPEVRKHAAKIVGRLERAALLTPKLVSINAEQTPVGQVFADLSRQTGYQMNCTQPNSHVVTARADRITFWEAIDLVCKNTGYGLQAYGTENDALTFVHVGQFSPHVSYAGQFRVSAAGFHLSRSLDLAVRQLFNPISPPRSETLTLTIQVVGEPKAALMSLGQPRLTLAEDDAGNSLVPKQGRVYESNYHDYSYSPRMAVRQTQLQLLGPGSAQTLRQVKGIVPVTYLAEKRPELTIDGIMSVKDKKFDSPQITLEIDEPKELPGQQVHIHATIRRNVGENQHDYSWTNSLAQRMELIDENGQKYASEGFNWDSGNPTSVTGTFQFNNGGNAKLGKPVKLVYYDWITAQHEISFDFRDLPLP